MYFCRYTLTHSYCLCMICKYCNKLAKITILDKFMLIFKFLKIICIKRAKQIIYTIFSVDNQLQGIDQSINKLQGNLEILESSGNSN